MSPPRALPHLLGLFACTPAPLGVTDGSSGQTSLAHDADPSGAAPKPDDPTSSSGAVTTDDADPVKFDVGVDKTPQGLYGCALDSPPGTMVSGHGEFGLFYARRAYFDRQDHKIHLLFVSPEADHAHEIVHQDGSSGPVFLGDAWTDWTVADDEFIWIGAWPLSGEVLVDPLRSEPEHPQVATITGLAGSWSAYDPADPARLVGTLAGALTGPFDAVFCDDLVLPIE
jgi:hypothetical protein